LRDLRERLGFLLPTGTIDDRVGGLVVLVDDGGLSSSRQNSVDVVLGYFLISEAFDESAATHVNGTSEAGGQNQGGPDAHAKHFWPLGVEGEATVDDGFRFSLEVADRDVSERRLGDEPVDLNDGVVGEDLRDVERRVGFTHCDVRT
jgi:hypothetical protein